MDRARAHKHSTCISPSVGSLGGFGGQSCILTTATPLACAQWTGRGRDLSRSPTVRRAQVATLVVDNAQKIPSALQQLGFINGRKHAERRFSMPLSR